jgi:hypothetical protein
LFAAEPAHTGRSPAGSESGTTLAGYWFDAYDAPSDKPEAWAPLFAARARTGI